MRNRILPLLIALLPLGILSGCVNQREVFVVPTSTDEVGSLPTEKEIYTGNTDVISKNEKNEQRENESKKLLKQTLNRKPEIEMREYVFEEEVKRFRRSTGIKVDSVFPFSDKEPDYQNGFILLKEPGRVRIIVKDSLLFELNKDMITDEAFLNKLAEAFKGNLIVVAAFFDNSGNGDFNRHITNKRAGIVKEYLLRNGVANGDILALGCSSNNPIAPNSTVNGRRLNRRIEFYIYPKGMFVEKVCEDK